MTTHRLPSRIQLLSSAGQCSAFVRLLCRFLLVVLAVQCMAYLPAGLYAIRHHHDAAPPGVVTVPSALSRLAALHTAAHMHDGEMHTHDDDFEIALADVQALGDSDEPGAEPVFALGASWPPGDLGVWIDNSDSVTCPAIVRFRSRCLAVHWKPPQS